MRANFRLQRLFIDTPLGPGTAHEVSAEQFNYLANVLRLEAGAQVLVFNGRDGEWLARVAFPSRKKIALELVEETGSTIWCRRRWRWAQDCCSRS